VRGGGEYGREWHKAGQLMNKPNTWRDLIAVCEHICAEGYTAPARLAIGGRSAGGITVGRALTERPDLFAAVIDGVGWSNPLRYVAEQNGYGEEPEWGAIAEKSGYEALKLIDSYQAVKDGTPYPRRAAHHRRHRSAGRAVPRGQDDRPAAGRDPRRASRSCCGWTSTRATASARPGRSRTARRWTPTPSCSGAPASRANQPA